MKGRAVIVLVGGSRGREGVVERRWKDKQGVWCIEARLDEKTVCRGPESDFRYADDSGDDIE